MNAWVIPGILIIVAVVVGIGAIALGSAGNTTTDSVKQEGKVISCSTCGNSCTSGSNCGLSTCGAVSGKGSCGCGR
jgi:hypothetical protein